MNFDEFKLLNIPEEPEITKTSDWDVSMEEVIRAIEKKLHFLETEKPKLFVVDCELEEIQANHERLKKATILDLRELQSEFEKKLNLAKTQYEKDLAFVEKLHTEKINQLNDTHNTEMNDAVKDYKDEIDYLERQFEELSNQKKRLKFQKMKTFFFRQMREAKKKVQQLNSERVQMKTQIQHLKRDLGEMKTKLRNGQTFWNGQNFGNAQNSGNAQNCVNAQNYGNAQSYANNAQSYANNAQNFGNGQNFPFAQSSGDFTAKQITKVEIQFFTETGKKDEGQKIDTNYLISRSDEIKRKLDTLDDAGYTDKIITEIVNEYSRIEMVLNNFKQYNDGFGKRSKFLKN